MRSPTATAALLLAACLALAAGSHARPLAQLAPGRRLRIYEDGVCEPDKEGGDPDCILGVCAYYAASNAAYWHAPGVCMEDPGCLGIEYGELDLPCAGLLEDPPTCSERCRAALAVISTKCMEELLKYEERQNEAWTSLPGGTALWFWRPVLGACGFVQEPGRHLAAAPQPLAAPPSALVHAHQQAAAKARAAAAKPVRPLRLQAAEPAAQP